MRNFYFSKFCQRHYDLNLASLRVAVAPLQVYGDTITGIRTMILLIPHPLIGFLVPPHTCRDATLPMSDLGPNIFAFKVLYQALHQPIFFGEFTLKIII